MKRTREWTVRAGVLLALLFTGASPVLGQGWIEPGVERGGSSVVKVRSDVQIRVEGRVAEVEVSEWFRNDGARVAEGEYLYPLAGEAVFRGFSLFQGETELRGEIMDADRARGIYEAIVRRRADPALIELAGHGLVRARVFPIEPGRTRKVTLRYTQLLERTGDALRIAYAGGVRAASGGVEAPRTDFRIVVDGCEAFLDPFSPTHELVADRIEDRMTIRVEGDISGRMAVFLPFAGEALGLSVATHRPVGEDGYFMLTLSPDRAAAEAQPRDVTVVMDVSGSMSGEKIEQARSALHQLLETLGPDDRFRLLSFSSAVRSFDRDWTRAERADLRRAGAWVDRLVADGGTNIEGALEAAFALESPRDRLPVVLFLTDGLPSVGAESPDDLARIAEVGAGRARVFAFGVGHDVNTRLLDRLGEAGRGDTDYVQPGESVERALSLLANKIRHPVLTELRLEGGPIDVGEVYPVRLPDVFAGEDLVLFGRFRGDGQSQLTVVGERAGRELRYSTEVVFPEASDADDYLPRLWASRKLGHLERLAWTEGMTEELGREIRSLALRYGLPSRFTAYLVQEPTVVAGRPDNTGRGSMAPAPTSGADAVQAASAARRMRAMASERELAAAEEALAQSVADQGGAARETVAGRVFELRDGVWTDLAHRAEVRTVLIRPFGDAWFALTRALPEIEGILKRYDSVVIAGGAVSVQVDPEGAERLTPERLAALVDDFRAPAR